MIKSNAQNQRLKSTLKVNARSLTSQMKKKEIKKRLPTGAKVGRFKRRE